MSCRVVSSQVSSHENALNRNWEIEFLLSLKCKNTLVRRKVSKDDNKWLIFGSRGRMKIPTFLDEIFFTCKSTVLTELIFENSSINFHIRESL